MSDKPFDMFFKWKPFTVDLEWVHSWLRSNAGRHYDGMSSDDAGATLHFVEEPSEQIKAYITQAYDNITSEEMLAALSHKHKMNLAVQQARFNIPVLTWDQMLPAERRLAMNQDLADSDKEALLAKYPQN